MYKKMTETLGAVAHELNNSLTVILGNVNLLTYNLLTFGLKSNHPMYEELKAIKNSTEIINDIIQRIWK